MLFYLYPYKYDYICECLNSHIVSDYPLLLNKLFFFVIAIYKYFGASLALLEAFFFWFFFSEINFLSEFRQFVIVYFGMTYF